MRPTKDGGGRAGAFKAEFWSGDQLDHELVALLKSLRPRYKTAILSNYWTNAREFFTHELGLDQAVDLLIISSEEGLAKPDPRLYALAADRLGVSPPAAVLVDDNQSNVEGARAAGMQAIRYQAGMDVREALEKLGVSPTRKGEASAE